MSTPRGVSARVPQSPSQSDDVLLASPSPSGTQQDLQEAATPELARPLNSHGAARQSQSLPVWRPALEESPNRPDANLVAALAAWQGSGPPGLLSEEGLVSMPPWVCESLGPRYESTSSQHPGLSAVAGAPRVPELGMNSSSGLSFVEQEAEIARFLGSLDDLLPDLQEPLLEDLQRPAADNVSSPYRSASLASLSTKERCAATLEAHCQEHEEDEEDDEGEAGTAELQLLCCPSCRRRFREDRLRVHEPICRKSAALPRQVFESKTQRLRALEGCWWILEEDRAVGRTSLPRPVVGGWQEERPVAARAPHGKTGQNTRPKAPQRHQSTPCVASRPSQAQARGVAPHESDARRRQKKLLPQEGQSGLARPQSACAPRRPLGTAATRRGKPAQGLSGRKGRDTGEARAHRQERSSNQSSTMRVSHDSISPRPNVTTKEPACFRTPSPKREDRTQSGLDMPSPAQSSCVSAHPLHRELTQEEVGEVGLAPRTPSPRRAGDASVEGDSPAWAVEPHTPPPRRSGGLSSQTQHSPDSEAGMHAVASAVHPVWSPSLPKRANTCPDLEVQGGACAGVQLLEFPPHLQEILARSGANDGHDGCGACPRTPSPKSSRWWAPKQHLAKEIDGLAPPWHPNVSTGTGGGSLSHSSSCEQDQAACSSTSLPSIPALPSLDFHSTDAPCAIELSGLSLGSLEGTSKLVAPPSGVARSGGGAPDLAQGWQTMLQDVAVLSAQVDDLLRRQQLLLEGGAPEPEPPPPQQPVRLSSPAQAFAAPLPASTAAPQTYDPGRYADSSVLEEVADAAEQQSLHVQEELRTKAQAVFARRCALQRWRKGGGEGDIAEEPGEAG